MIRSHSCSWCRAFNREGVRWCASCRHAAHKPRMWCDCPACQSMTNVLQGVGVTRTRIRFSQAEEILQEIREFFVIYHDSLTPIQMQLWTRVMETTVLFVANLTAHDDAVFPPSPVE